MAVLNTEQKKYLEIALDVGLVLVAADIVWSIFFGQKPPVQFFHDVIAILGTAAAAWLVWKLARKNTAL